MLSSKHLVLVQQAFQTLPTCQFFFQGKFGMFQPALQIQPILPFFFHGTFGLSKLLFHNSQLNADEDNLILMQRTSAQKIIAALSAASGKQKHC